MTETTPPAVWVDGDPLMEAIAAAVWEHCARDSEDMPQLVCDDPRTIAAFAAAVARAHAAVPAPATDRDALRKLISRAIHRYDHDHLLSVNDMPGEHHYGEADAVLSVLPAPVDRAATLRELEQRYRPNTPPSRPELRSMAGEPQQAETQPTGWHLTPQTLDLFVRALVNKVDYDIHKGYECGEEDGEDHYPELVAAAAEMLDAITKPRPFIPPAHYRRDDGVDCCVHTIPVGPDSCPACRELHDDEQPTTP